MWRRGQERVAKDIRTRAEVDRAVMHAAVYEALTDLYAILPLGRDRRGNATPLLRKRGQPSSKPGLTGAALERAVDQFVARLGAGAGRGRVN